MSVVDDQPAQRFLCGHISGSGDLAERVQRRIAKCFLFRFDNGVLEDTHGVCRAVRRQRFHSLRLQPGADQRQAAGEVLPAFLNLARVHLSSGVLFAPRIASSYGN